ncbi:MAG: hypothetical protein JWO33_560 [Caulobacteraceae bacterium]|nr:hypothetical protein [Caulobacteraceae bacterium]
MRYRSFGARPATVSAITLRLDATRRKGNAVDWRDFVFAALESGVNAFEIGHTSAPMLVGVAEAFAAVERRLFLVSWRTTLSGGAVETARRVNDLTDSLGLTQIDLLTLELEGPLRDPGVLSDLRQTEVARWFAVAGPASVIDEAIAGGQFDAVVMKSDPSGGWNERNRIRAAAARGMGVIAVDVGLEIGVTEEAPARGGLLDLFRPRPAPPEPRFRIQVPGWTEQEIAVAHALTDTAISTIMVQPSCTATLEGLAHAVERDLPAGAQAQIEMARFSGPGVQVERRKVRRA